MMKNKLTQGDRRTQTVCFLIFAALLGAVKQMLVQDLPIFAITPGLMDDALMVRGAQSLLQGGLHSWLGAYDQFTLVKGCFFPIFLAVINRLGISYIDAATLLYTVSCIVLILAISETFQMKFALYFSYAVLLFNPASFAAAVLQRVYRNSISEAQVLLILACFFALYLRRKEHAAKLFLWSVVGGLAWASMEHSREDAMWIMPVLIVIAVISVLTVVTEERRNIKRLLARLAVLALPFVIFAASHPAVSYINFRKYGLYSYNELNDSHFSDAMKAIYGVKMEGEDMPYVTASRAKLKKLYEVSPTLKQLEDRLESQMDAWDTADRNPGDKEVEDGWFFWVLREAAAGAGFYESAGKADACFRQMAEEINAAFESGQLEKQPVMPSALMPPWKKGRGAAVMDAFGRIIPYVTTYTTLDVMPTESMSNGAGGIALFEAVTGNRAIYPEDEPSPEPPLEAGRVMKCLGRLNGITRIYQATGVIAALIGAFSWLLLTVSILRSADERRKHLDQWLVLTGLLGSMICLFGGVAYNHAASCYSITYLYLCAAYPLMIAFWTLGGGVAVGKLSKNALVR